MYTILILDSDHKVKAVAHKVDMPGVDGRTCVDAPVAFAHDDMFGHDLLIRSVSFNGEPTSLGHLRWDDWKHVYRAGL